MLKFIAKHAMIIITTVLLVWMWMANNRRCHKQWEYKTNQTKGMMYVARIDLGEFTAFANDKRQCPNGYTTNMFPGGQGRGDPKKACKKRKLTVKNQRIMWVKKNPNP